MKLTKKLEAEILQVYNAYWDSYLKGDLKSMARLLDDSYTQVGSAETEVFFNKKDAVKFLHDTIDQVSGRLEMRNRKIKPVFSEAGVLINELCNVFVLANNEWIFYSKFRASTFMAEKNGEWKIIHQHSSFPDTRTEEGGNIAIEKISAENLQLREAVKRRTIELEEKNQELKVEAALERVRAKTMAMQNTEELKGVIAVVLKQMQELGISMKERSAIINVFNEGVKDFNQWVASPQHDATISLFTPYFDHPIHKDLWNARVDETTFYSQSYTLKDKNTFFQYLFEHTDLKDTPEQEKELLLQYKYYELAVAFGKNSAISLANFSENPIAEDIKNIMRRLAKVFEQTYTRFLDLQKAEAQAREAQIQLAMERVRARTMAMHYSKELIETANVMFQQIELLGIPAWTCGFHILADDEVSTNSFMSSKGTIMTPFNLPLKGEESFLEWYQCLQRKDDYFKQELSGKKLENHNNYLRSLPAIRDIVKKGEQDGSHLPTFQINHLSFFKYGFLLFITYKEIPDADDIFKKFTKVFEQAYTRFLDLQKAEAQTREAEIELALERVRARTMAMHRSDELTDAAKVLFEEFKKLTTESKDVILGRGFIIVMNELQQCAELWITDRQGNEINQFFKIHFSESTHGKLVYQAWLSKQPHLIVDLEGKELHEWLDYLSSIDFPVAHDVIGNRSVNNFIFHTKGFIGITSSIPLAQDSIFILERFAKVFEQTYTRFLDLQKAEAQAREAQIEAALERVRSRTMAMQRSEELKEASQLLFHQVQTFGVDQWACGYNIWEADLQTCMAWMSRQGSLQPPFKTSFSADPCFKRFYEAKQRGEVFYMEEMGGDEIKAHYQRLLSLPEFESASRDFFDEFIAPKFQIFHIVHFEQGYLMFITYEPVPQLWDIFERFSKVFEQTYTRFLDLQKAEAQTREAQIEAALEKVRSRSLAMHNSKEVKEVITVVMVQLTLLGFHVDLANFNFRTTTRDWSMWLATPDYSYPDIIHLPYIKHPLFDHPIEAVTKGLDFMSDILNREESNTAMKHFYNNTILRDHDNAERKKYVAESKGLARSIVFLKHTILTISNFQAIPYTEEQNSIVRRFANVFEQAYVRFLDLQKAEAQAREARIEAGLERVRFKAMAMQSSEDVGSATAAVFHEISLLNVETMRCGTVIFNSDKTAEVWAATTTAEGKEMKGVGSINLLQHPLWIGLMNAWQEKKDNYSYRLEGDDRKAYYAVLANSPNYKAPYLAEEMPDHYFYASYFNEGAIFSFSLQQYSPENQRILSKFTAVFSLTFRRFQDLQKAEAQTKEAKIEASLERVRGMAMAMHSSQDLADTIGVFYKELQIFSLTPRRCGVGLLDREARVGDLFTWNTTEKGESLELIGRLKMEGHLVLNNVYESWLTQTEYHPVLQGNEIKEYYKILRPQIAFPDYQQDEVQYGYFFFFTEGGVYAWTEKEMQEDELQIYRRFTSVLSLTYKRYKDLKIAEAHAQQAEEDLIKLQIEKKRAEDALTELLSTQKQLIQSEKMASLGELTAGIAHEIQNPLNFVNNFSEVNAELLEELKAERLKPKAERNETLEDEIIKDVINNEEKINHHGKRADSIVKGMLQHSRNSTGQKEPTDINALTDEYLRLAYHGLRAKDNSFNAAMVTDYDESVGKINVLPQDIGRVVLNLITNAFYAVTEKKKQNLSGYEPSIKVSTKRNQGNILICVEDNGNGIPDKVVNKIFQPFFTTKPTGQGTGLGLSLSYDIVKAHGGELTVETTEGEGSEFIIQL